MSDNSDFRKQLYVIIAIVVFALFSAGIYEYGQYRRSKLPIVSFVSPVDACQCVDIRKDYRKLIGTYVSVVTNNDVLATSGNRKIYVELTDEVEGINLINVFTAAPESTPVGSTVTIRIDDIFLSPYGDGSCSVNIVGEVINSQ